MNQRDECTQPVNREGTVWIQKAIMPYLHKSLWHYMLQEPSDKLHGLKFHGLPCFPLTVFIGKPDGIIRYAFNTVIGDSYPEHIP